jgi:hypothetical protein
MTIFVSACSDGCNSTSSTSPTPSTEDCTGLRCSAGTPGGLPAGLDSQGRVDITAAQAWPNRPAEPASLTPQQLADACALISACEVDGNGQPLADDVLAADTQSCAKGTSSRSAKEERAIPQAGLYERFGFEARAALAGTPGCATVRALETKRPAQILCQEDGCWWESPVPPPPQCCQPVPTVTCNGDVATVVTTGLTFTRDCTRAYTKCDPTSSTGCSDRKPVACDSKAHDKCDGSVRLGCDGDGRVSFHDCAGYPGGFCDDSDPTNPQCNTGASACANKPAGCDATNPKLLDVCVGGNTVVVDCEALGLGACSNGHCAPK